ncbi:MAG: hypothetical protein ACRC6H_10490 [Culicoidibacterales bacterium]
MMMKKMYQAGELPKESGLYHLVSVIEKKVEATVNKVVIYVGPQQKLPKIDVEGHAWVKA